MSHATRDELSEWMINVTVYATWPYIKLDSKRERLYCIGGDSRNCEPSQIGDCCGKGCIATAWILAWHQATCDSLCTASQIAGAWRFARYKNIRNRLYIWESLHGEASWWIGGKPASICNVPKKRGTLKVNYLAGFFMEKAVKDCISWRIGCVYVVDYTK